MLTTDQMFAHALSNTLLEPTTRKSNCFRGTYDDVVRYHLQVSITGSFDPQTMTLLWRR